jgi:hypothetical protein
MFYNHSYVSTKGGFLNITTTSERTRWKGFNAYRKKYEVRTGVVVVMMMMRLLVMGTTSDEHDAANANASGSVRFGRAHAHAHLSGHSPATGEALPRGHADDQPSS